MIRIAVLGVAVVAGAVGGCSALHCSSADSATASLYFDTPGKGVVRVFGYNDGIRGGEVSDYASIPEPVRVRPGYVEIIFACPDATIFKYDNTGVVKVPHPGSYYIYCEAHQNVLKIMPKP